MIREFSIKLKPSNNKARNAFIFCISLAFIGLFSSSLLTRYNGVVGLFSVAFLVAALQIYTKYMTSNYYIDIIFDSDGVPILVVRQITGKRSTTLCRIGLSEIESIDREDRNDRRDHKTPDEYRKYVYCPSLDPEICYRITVINSYEKAEILTELTDEMADTLRTYVDQAKNSAI